MNKADILILLQSNLDMIVLDETRTAQLEHLIDASIKYIEREGVTFTTATVDDVTTYAFTVEEADIVVMYASYLFRKRKTDEGMPRMLRWALNNLLFSQKAQVANDT